MDQGEKRKMVKSWKTETDIYMHMHRSPCTKYKVDNYENLLYSTGNANQCSVLT